MLDKTVANTFSNAAKHYKQHDVLQRLTAASLLKHAQLHGHLADIGCGPGTCFKHFDAISEVTAVDIAPGMLTQVQHDYPHYQTLCCDVQALSFDSSSIDSVYSNLALQWCQDFAQAIHQLHRVLKVTGSCHLAIVAQGSLPELTTLGFRTNEFLSLPSMLRAFGIAEIDDQSQMKSDKWLINDAKIEAVTVYFDDLRSLLYSIKGVGASAPNALNQLNLNQPSTVLTKSQWEQKLLLAQRLRTEKGIPLTYQIAFIHAQKCKER
ncbi:methyltransferase domain-containing protein [Shewanella aestuarii]|uniref:Methyltransferase domain-containing protein n=1 Tax=Shewanella aestuarii TaxID=1028752 RepID=A0A6G9QJR8_9GAMM|nr:methyltransferase domain-containing protein [Shewanella aestuarii]QIR14800.1 methyltransferase domain-containing protein [Shewanella aestuarii]